MTDSEDLEYYKRLSQELEKQVKTLVDVIVKYTPWDPDAGTIEEDEDEAWDVQEHNEIQRIMDEL